MTQQMLDGQYPETWDEFVGQDKAVRQLKIAVRSAKARGVTPGHILLKSPFAGLGKTSLALMVARELDVPMWTISGAPKLSELRMLFSQMEDGDVLLYEEVHKAVDRGKAASEWMLHALENGTLMTPLGPEPIPRFTMIATTTDAGLIPGPILQRFEIQPELVPYTTEEAAGIAVQLAHKLLAPEGLPVPDGETARAIAEAASNRPRWMRRILATLRDLAMVEEITYTAEGKYPLAEALDYVGLTPDGLTPEAVNYLRVLVTELRGEPAGASLLKERLGEVGKGLNDIEQLLLDKGLIAKTKQGRVLTTVGLKRGRELAA